MTQRIVTTMHPSIEPVLLDHVALETHQSNSIVMYKAKTNPGNDEYMSLLVRREGKYGFIPLNNGVVWTNKLTYRAYTPQSAISQAIKCGREVLVVDATDLVKLITGC